MGGWGTVLCFLGSWVVWSEGAQAAAGAVAARRHPASRRGRGPFRAWAQQARQRGPRDPRALPGRARGAQDAGTPRLRALPPASRRRVHDGWLAPSVLP